MLFVAGVTSNERVCELMLFGRTKRTLTRLLIVEDEPLLAFDTEYFLTDEDYEIVATVDRVVDARARIDGEEIHLVLVDMSLADGSGLEVARAAAAKGVPVLLVTGQSPDGAEDVAHGCLMKPYAQRALLKAIEAIDQVLQGHRPKKLPDGFRLFRQPEGAAG